MIIGTVYSKFDLKLGGIPVYWIPKTIINKDILEILANSCARSGLKLGIYYSLMDKNTPFYDDDRRFMDLVFLQLEELLNNYGDIIELWFDGFWEKQSSGWVLPPTDFVYAWRKEGAFRLNMDFIYRNIKNWQSNCKKH